MRRVLVTGGAGFIGSHLVEALVARGDQIRVLDDFSTGALGNLAAVQSRIEVVRGDVADPVTVRRAMEGITHVVHAAAIRSITLSMDDPLWCHRINVEGTLNVLEAARRARVQRLVFASSSAVYDSDAAGPVSEDQPAYPISPYGVSKLAGELYARLFRELYALDVVCLRYFSVFGPRMDGESDYAMAIPRFVSSLLRGEAPPVYGDGHQRRDFLYVGDAVAAARQALAIRDAGPVVFNIGGGQDCSILDVVAILNRLLGTQVAPRHLPARAGEARRTLADITRAKTILGFTPAISFEEGLTQTVTWFRERA